MQVHQYGLGPKAAHVIEPEPTPSGTPPVPSANVVLLNSTAGYVVVLKLVSRSEHETPHGRAELIIEVEDIQPMVQPLLNQRAVAVLEPAEPTVAQKAMLNLTEEERAAFIARTAKQRLADRSDPAHRHAVQK